MNGTIEGIAITKITKSGCMGEWTLKFEYANGATRNLAFANKTHMERAIDVIKQLMVQHNTIIEIIDENC